ncbi:MAG TPA: DNA gyrase inhibitor YacG [Hyphomonadaceae bacterium]|nr:DNA gyrase inhibitor YacG [Hyphomonadaceae bacterium]
MAESPADGNCPICGRPTVHEFRPFCSRRCAHIDLARWLRGAYAIPGDPVEPDQAPVTDAGEGEANDSGRKH